MYLKKHCIQVVSKKETYNLPVNQERDGPFIRLVQVHYPVAVVVVAGREVIN